MNDFEKQKKVIVDYFNSNEKKEELKLGIEFEHFVLNKEDFSFVSYYDEKGVKYILNSLVQKGWKPKYENNNILGATKGYSEISIEPGSQLELSVGPFKDIRDIDIAYKKFLSDIIPIIEENNQILLSLGYQPKTKISEIPFIPKKRYEYMSSYFKNKGKYALNMMKGTAALQVSIDYTSEEDFVRKFKVANGLSPIFSALLDNSPFFEGMLWDKNCVRTLIWNNCDNDRSGILTSIDDEVFGYKKYAEYILNVPPILMLDGDGVEFTGDKKFREIFDVEKYDKKKLEHALTMVFPDVRAKQFIEIRMPDAVPYPYNVGFASLIKGIMYNDQALSKVDKIISAVKAKELKKVRGEIIKSGIFARYAGKPIYEIAEELLDIAKDSLDEEEGRYLQPLFDIVKKRTTLSSEVKENLGCDMEKALEKQILNRRFSMDNSQCTSHN
ncbi:glutamate--cysteine ligase [Clostridium sp. DL1XJH146]